MLENTWILRIEIGLCYDNYCLKRPNLKTNKVNEKLATKIRLLDLINQIRVKEKEDCKFARSE